MKKIRKIALVELQSFFYSPVAWLILIVFTFQVAMIFTDLLEVQARNQELKQPLSNLSLSLCKGMFAKIQEYLYFYIPLLTMGLMSRELSSGSIKLLYSSPVSNARIILGKYLSMLLYGLVMMAILFVFVAWSSYTVKDFDWPVALSGMLGLYLLLGVYAAIGLFMSSLTSYQVVAAVGTLALLAALESVKRFGQELDFVREITWWLSISGRAGEAIGGLLCSEDILYFIIVAALFLAFSVARLKAIRQKYRWYLAFTRYAGLFLLAALLGYATSRPRLMFFHDATRTKQRTLTPVSQEIIRRLDGGLKMTVYVNALDRLLSAGLPRARKADLERFAQYTRFKPGMDVEYVYYYKNPGNQGLDRRYRDLPDRRVLGKISKAWDVDSNLFMPPAEIDRIIDLAPEGYRLVRLLERESGEKTFLRMFDDMTRYPSEAEISAALKRLVMKAPVVAFLEGHGERAVDDAGDRGYYRFSCNKPGRSSLVNQGFDCVTVTLQRDIPAAVDILVIADARRPLDAGELARLDAYIARGGNLVILGEPRRGEAMNPVVAPFGVAFLPGQLVRYPREAETVTVPNVSSFSPGGDTRPPRVQVAPDFMRLALGREAARLSRLHESLYNVTRGGGARVAMPGCAALSVEADKGFDVITLFESDGVDGWNELQTTNFVDDTARVDPRSGEERRAYPAALALTRAVGEKVQKVMITGDADCFSNERATGVNANFIMATFLWMSDGALPVDVRRPAPPDNVLFATGDDVKVARRVLAIAFPALLLAISLLSWLRRRSR
ncbi:MAG: Gldg family protein [Odoribacteraceae bacterium]|jgi:ABC-2 type transport system permease protein|nr:Gldg family protein [Odoribacteraceae bacterium]